MEQNLNANVPKVPVKKDKKDKKEKKDLMKRLKHEIRPYPKDTASYNTEVVHHLTTYEAPEGAENFW